VALTAGTPYYIYVDGYNTNSGNYVLTIRDQCEVLSQPDDAFECAEVNAPGHELTDCNGACNNPIGSQTWQNLLLCQSIYGRLFTYIGNDNLEWRDMDVYRFTLTEPCSVRITLQSEITTRMFILSDNCPWSAVYSPPLWQYPCSTGVFTSQCLQAGTYNLWIAPNVFTGINEYRDYRLRLDPIPCSGCKIDSSLVAPGMISGFTCEDGNDCNWVASDDNMLCVVIPHDGMWTFSLCNSAPWDSRLFLFESCCGPIIAMDDDGCGDLTAAIECRQLTAGTYYVLIAGWLPFPCGYYELTVSECSGSCCYGDFLSPQCAQTTYLECEVLSGVFTPLEPCVEGACPVRRPCPDNSIFSQYVPLPEEDWDSFRSHLDYGSVYCDNYSVNGPIGQIRFWGFPYACSGPPENFRIEFSDDVNPPQVYNVTLQGEQHPEYWYMFASHVLNEYTATLSPPCTITEGVVSVMKVGNPECEWYWITSPYGDNQGPCGGWDFSFCFAPPAPCEPVDSLSIIWESTDIYRLDWRQQQAGTVTLWLTTDPNAVFPVSYVPSGSVYLGAGWHAASLGSFADYVNAVMILDCGSGPAALQGVGENVEHRFRLIE
jgi:hypothetical protein